MNAECTDSEVLVLIPLKDQEGYCYGISILYARFGFVTSLKVKKIQGVPIKATEF